MPPTTTISTAASPAAKPARAAAPRRRTGPPRWDRVLVLLVFTWAVATWAITWAIRQHGGLQPLELAAYDWLLRWQPRDERCKDKILIVNITEEDLKRYDYPISDGALAKAIANVLKRGASSVAVDIIRNKPQGDPQGTEQLTRLFAPVKDATGDEHDNPLVWAFCYGQQGQVPVDAPAALGKLRWGCCECCPDSDRVVRRGLLAALDDKRESVNSLAFKAALAVIVDPLEQRWAQAHGKKAADLTDAEYQQFRQEVFPCLFCTPQPADDTIWISPEKVAYRPIHGHEGPFVRLEGELGKQIPLDFRGPLEYETITLDEAIHEHFADAQAGGRIVLIGSEARTVKDYIPTPLDARLGRPTPMWGVEFHAAVIDNLLRQAMHGVPPVTYWSSVAGMFWLLGWCLAGAAMALVCRTYTLAIPALLLGNVLLLLFAYLVFNVYWVWVPVVPPLLGWNISGLFTIFYVERRARAVMQLLVARTLPQRIYNVLCSQFDVLRRNKAIESHLGVATILFSDVQGYSDISRVLRGNETQLIAWLNQYLRAMADVIQSKEFGGLVLSYAGDGIMAVFGPPEFENHPLLKGSVAEISGVCPDFARHAPLARAAVDCALRMRARLSDLRREWGAMPEARSIRVRIGIFTGYVTDGLLGGGGRIDYSVIGDAVNTAARLEQWDKTEMSNDIAALGCRIVIGQPTYELLPHGRYTTVELGTVELHGVGKVAAHAVYD